MVSGREWQFSSIRHKKISAKQLQEKVYLADYKTWRRKNLALPPAFILGCMRTWRWESDAGMWVAFLRGKPWGRQRSLSWTLDILDSLNQLPNYLFQASCYVRFIFRSWSIKPFSISWLDTCSQKHHKLLRLCFFL